MNELFLIKFIRFCIVGGSGVVVDFGITYLLKERMRLNKYAANSCGFLTAATTNYILNRIWTFRSIDPHIARQYLIFIAISLAGLAINNGVIWLLNDRLHTDFARLAGHRAPEGQLREKVNFYSAKLMAVIVVTLWNFLMNYYYNFT